MNREEALKQIEEINMALAASNQLLLSGMLSIFIGLTVLMLPFIEIPTQQLTFGHDFGSWRVYVLPAIHVVVYLSLFSLVRWTVEKKWIEARIKAPHPALAQALAVHRPVIAAICGTIIMLGYLGIDQLVYPFFLIFFGILMNFYGRFSNPRLFWAGWSYIILGLIFGAMTRMNRPYLWIAFNTYLGVSLIIVGISIRKERKS